MAQARRRSKIGLCWGWVLSLLGWRRGGCRQAGGQRAGLHLGCCAKKRSNNIAKNSGLAGVITFWWWGLFSHDLNTSSSKSPYAVNRSGESSSCSASLLGTDTPFALTPDSQRIKEAFVQQCRNVVCPISIKSFSHGIAAITGFQFDIGVVI